MSIFYRLVDSVALWPDCAKAQADMKLLSPQMACFTQQWKGLKGAYEFHNNHSDIGPLWQCHHVGLFIISSNNEIQQKEHYRNYR